MWRAHAFRGSNASASRKLGLRFGLATKTTQRNRANSLRIKVVGVGAKAVRDMLKALLPTCGAGVKLRESPVRGRTPCGVPCGFIESGIRLVEAALIAERQTELIVRLAVVRIRIAMRQARDGCTQMCFGQRKLAPLQVPRAQCGVGASVAGITEDGLAPVWLGAARCVPVLLQVKACEVEFVVARNLLGRRGNGRSFRRRHRLRTLPGTNCKRQRPSMFQGHGESELLTNTGSKLKAFTTSGSATEILWRHSQM